MKIAFVTMQFGRSYTQGTERYVGSLGRCLSERGHQVVYLAGDPQGRGHSCKVAEPIDTGRRIFAYPTRGWLAVSGISTKRISQWLQRERPDVVHLANPAHIGAGIIQVCKRLGIPVVVTVMDFWWVCPKAVLLKDDGTICDGTPGWSECVRCMSADHPETRLRWLGRLPRILSPITLLLYYARAALRKMSPADMFRWTRRRSILIDYLNKADRVIFLSQAARQIIGEKLTKPRCPVIHLGLQSEWFDKPAKPLFPETVSPDDLTIGYTGALATHKAPHLLLEAVRRLGWHRTLIRLAGPAGDPDYRDRLKTGADGLNVEFVGQIDTAAMADFYRSLDISAMTSNCLENYPFAVLEALAAGVPVVGAKVGGIPEQISDERLLFEPGSADGLADALKFVREHPDQIRIPNVMTAETMTDQIEAVYREVLSGRQDS